MTSFSKAFAKSKKKREGIKGKGYDKRMMERERGRGLRWFNELNGAPKNTCLCPHSCNLEKSF
jgi:hypothetical protein